MTDISLQIIIKNIGRVKQRKKDVNGEELNEDFYLLDYKYG